MTTSTEIWKPIPDFPGYDVSDRGCVRSYHQSGTSMIAKMPVRILKSSNKRMYGQVCLSRNGIHYSRRVARLVMETFLGPCPDGLEVCHNDGNSKNDCLENLRYGTHFENIQDAIMHGTTKRFLSDVEAKQARLLRAAGFPIVQLSKLYSIPHVSIREICAGKTYRDVGGPYTNARTLGIPKARKIRQDRKAGYSLEQLTRKYGLAVSTISLIVNNKRWKEKA